MDMSAHLAAIGERVERIKQSQVYETQADIDRERLYDMLKASKSFDLLITVMGYGLEEDDVYEEP